jgi:hypothetical protein
MNAAALAYAGVIPPIMQPEKDIPGAPFATMLQLVINKCIEMPGLADELFMHLIKLTTEHPDADSKEVLSLWKFFSIAVGCVRPTTHEVQEYVKAHLKRASSLEAKPADHRVRKQESDHAKYCMKIFYRCVYSDARKCPPSAEEMQFVTVCWPPNLCRYSVLIFRTLALESFADSILFPGWSVQGNSARSIFDREGGIRWVFWILTCLQNSMFLITNTHTCSPALGQDSNERRHWFCVV